MTEEDEGKLYLPLPRLTKVGNRKEALLPSEWVKVGS